MPKKSLRYLIFNELLIADSEWFDDSVCPETTRERGEEYFDYLANKVAKMLKKENKYESKRKSFKSIL